MIADFDEYSILHVDKTTFAARTDVEGVVGERTQHTLDAGPVRNQHVAYELAKRVLANKTLTGHDGEPIHTRFPQIVAIAKEWLDGYVTYEPGCDASMLLIAEWRQRAAERIERSIIRMPDAPRPILRPLLDRFDAVGTTDNVAFMTRKVVVPTEKSPVNYVTLDGIKGKGNTWEETVAMLLEQHPEVESYVKNDGLDFMIPYVHAGVGHEYKPDFIVKLCQRAGDETERYLIVEVSGTRKDQDLRRAKAEAADERWCTAVNNHGGFGKWSFIEISKMEYAASALNNEILRLFADNLTEALMDVMTEDA